MNDLRLAVGPRERLSIFPRRRSMVEQPRPLVARLTVLPCRGGEEILKGFSSRFNRRQKQARPNSSGCEMPREEIPPNHLRTGVHGTATLGSTLFTGNKRLARVCLGY